MTDEESTIDRRSVLKATGAALGLGLGAAGTASADHFASGSCGRITLDNQSHDEPCSFDEEGPIFEKGTEGIVWGTCTADNGTEMVDFQSEELETYGDRGWVNNAYIEHC